MSQPGTYATRSNPAFCILCFGIPTNRPRSVAVLCVVRCGIRINRPRSVSALCALRSGIRINRPRSVAVLRIAHCRIPTNRHRSTAVLCTLHCGIPTNRPRSVSAFCVLRSGIPANRHRSTAGICSLLVVRVTSSQTTRSTRPIKQHTPDLLGVCLSWLNAWCDLCLAYAGRSGKSSMPISLQYFKNKSKSPLLATSNKSPRLPHFRT